MFEQIAPWARTGQGWLLAALLLLSFSSPALAGLVQDDGELEVSVVDADRVYHPVRVRKGQKFKKPAILTTSTIFDEIKEWKEIKKKGLTESDAEYHLLLKRVNEKFDSALKKVQKDGSYDIIAEDGAIAVKNGQADDITQKVIDALP